MSKELRQRATVIVEWGENRGVIVHGDHDGFWLLPGGKLNNPKGRDKESALLGAVRELREETGLVARGVLFLFRHTGKYNDHHVFLIQASGTPAVVDTKEVSAIGIIDTDMHVAWIDVTPGFDVSNLKPMNSSRDIIEHYFALRTQRPALWEGLAALEASWGEGTTVPAPAKHAPVPESAPAPTPTRRDAPAPMRDGKTTRIQIGAAVLELIQGDIVVQDVDAIVNAANEGLAEGSGVCGAIFKAAGSYDLAKACRPQAPCPTGEARITDGFGKLKNRRIIHAVGPVYNRDNLQESARLLASAYRSSLALAAEHGLASVAFPSLSTGVFGYPINDAAGVALSAVRDFLAALSSVRLVRFVLWDQKSFDAYDRAVNGLGLTSATPTKPNPEERPIITQAKVYMSRRLGRVMSHIPFEQQDAVRKAYESCDSYTELSAAIKKIVEDTEQRVGVTPDRWPSDLD